MNKDEFIEWLNSTSFEKIGSNYRDLMNYSEYIFDYLDINENTVTFTWEEWYLGGRENRTTEYTFEEFIERYNNSDLKNGLYS